MDGAGTDRTRSPDDRGLWTGPSRLGRCERRGSALSALPCRMKLHAPVPILRMFDEAKAREFYVGWAWFAGRLGASLRPGSAALHAGVARRLRPAPERASRRRVPGGRPCRVEVDELEAYALERARPRPPRSRQGLLDARACRTKGVGRARDDRAGRRRATRLVIRPQPADDVGGLTSSSPAGDELRAPGKLRASGRLRPGELIGPATISSASSTTGLRRRHASGRVGRPATASMHG